MTPERSDRLKSRGISSLVTAVVLTVGALTLVGRQYDATTVFGPTDEAMRQIVSAGTFEGQQPILTNEARREECFRIAWGATRPASVGKAVYHLASASLLTDRLELHDLNSPGGLVYDNVVAKVMERIRQLDPEMGEIPNRNPREIEEDHPIALIQQATGIPVGLWADFVYLDLKLDHFGTPRDSLRPERLEETVKDLTRRVAPESASGREVMLMVRHRDPRMAEVLANAITATYKYHYDQAILQGTLKNLQYFQAQRNKAAMEYGRAMSSLARWRDANRAYYLEDQLADTVEMRKEARLTLLKLESDMRDVDAQIAAKKARLAKTPKMREQSEKVQDPQIATLSDLIATREAELSIKLAAKTEQSPDVRRLKDEITTGKRHLKLIDGSLVTRASAVENEDWLVLQREIAGLVDTRKGLAARVTVAEKAMAEANQMMARWPTASVQGKMLSGAVQAAGDRLNLANQKLQRAEEEFQRTDDTGALFVSVWAGLPPGTKSHPESPATEGATRKKSALVVTTFLLGFMGSFGVYSVMGAFRRDVDAARRRPEAITLEAATLEEPATRESEADSNF